MISNFNKFKYSLILESILKVDDNFTKIILKILGTYGNDKPEYKIAKSIYDLYSIDIKTDYNDIGVSSNNTDVEFIPDVKYQSGYNGTKSSIKIGRMVRKLFKDNNIDNFTDYDFEKFVYAYKGAYDTLFSIKKVVNVVKGDDIKYWYNLENYYDTSGTLGNSCMRYVGSHYFEIYSQNPDVCSLVILVEDNKLKGRALLWKLDNGGLYLDRIYSRTYSDVEMILNYMKENYSNFLYHSNEDNENNNLKVTLKNSKFEYYPYLDSLFYIYFKLNNDRTLSDISFLSNMKNNDNGYVIYQLNSTDGGMQISCDYVEMEDGKFYHNSEVAYVGYLGTYYPKNLCVLSNDKYYLKSDVTYSNELERYILNEYVIEVDGKIYDRSGISFIVKDINCRYLDPLFIKNECLTKGVENVLEYEIIYRDYDNNDGYVRVKFPDWLSQLINNGVTTNTAFYIDEKYAIGKESFFDVLSCLDTYIGIRVLENIFNITDIDLFGYNKEGLRKINIDAYLKSYRTIDISLMRKVLSKMNSSNLVTRKLKELELIEKEVDTITLDVNYILKKEKEIRDILKSKYFIKKLKEYNDPSILETYSKYLNYIIADLISNRTMYVSVYDFDITRNKIRNENIENMDNLKIIVRNLNDINDDLYGKIDNIISDSKLKNYKYNFFLLDKIKE